jgi:hypothetical protein
MFILLTIAITILKYLALAVVGLFFFEDLELTKDVGGSIYSAYLTLGVLTFLTLTFFVLGKRLIWLILFIVFGMSYLSMYNQAPQIKEIHQSNNLKSRYFQDTGTFFDRMSDVWHMVTNKIK